MENKSRLFWGSYIGFWVIWLIVQTFLYSIIIKLPQFTSTYDLLINFVIKGVVWLTLTFWLLHTFKKQLFVEKQKLFNRNFPKEFWILLVIFLTYLFISAISSKHGIKLINHPFTTRGGQLLGIVFGAGFFEELVFRAGYLNILLTKVKKWPAIFISTIMFLLIHLPVYFVSNMNISAWIINILTVLVIGTLMGWIFTKSKNIWPSIILHCVWDSLTFLLIA